MKLTRVALVLVSATLRPTFAQLPEDLKRRFDDADRRIVRLSPTAFPELPRAVASELDHRGCTVPQTPHTKRRQNVISGEFARPGQTDWAVLCSVNRTSWLGTLFSTPHYVSSILVFWNGSAKDPAEIAPKEDRTFLQGITATEIGFSRIIGAAGKDFIMRHYRAYGGPTPPEIRHQGIDDGFAEKGSETWYFHNGKWLKLTGAD